MTELIAKPIVVYGGPLFNGIDQFWENGAIFIENGKIAAIGTEEEVFERIPKALDIDTYDSMGNVIFPGLINLHHHFYLSLAKGFPATGPLDSYQDRLRNFWWKLDKALDLNAIQLSALVSILDLIRSGVTTVFDHHSSPLIVKNSLESIVGAVKRSGIRANLCYGVSDRHGERVMHQGLEENLAVMERYTGDNNISGTMGLYANFALSEESLKEIAGRYQPEMGIHILVGEDSTDLKHSQDLGYDGPVDRLQHFGLLSNKALLVHGLHLSPKDLRLIAESGATLVHNPESNMLHNVGSLTLPLPEDISTGFGTDGLSSNPLNALRSAYYHYRSTGLEDKVIIPALMNALFEGNRKAAGRYFNGYPGVLKEGTRADITVFAYMPLSPFQSDTLFEHLIAGISQRQAGMVMAGGHIIFSEHAFYTLDEEVVRSEAQKVGKFVFNRYLA